VDVAAQGHLAAVRSHMDLPGLRLGIPDECFLNFCLDGANGKSAFGN
jgi:hypothetical protein